MTNQSTAKEALVMFPTANSTIYRNEDGEVLGWDNDYGYEPDYNPDDYLAADYDEDDCDPDTCTHADASKSHGVWTCDRCGTETLIEGEDGLPLFERVN